MHRILRIDELDDILRKCRQLLSTSLLVLRDKAIKPLLAASPELRPSRGPQNPRPIDTHYQSIYFGMQGVFHELGIGP